MKWIKLTYAGGGPVYINVALAREMARQGDTTCIWDGTENIDVKESPEEILRLASDPITEPIDPPKEEGLNIGCNVSGPTRFERFLLKDNLLFQSEKLGKNTFILNTGYYYHGQEKLVVLASKDCKLKVHGNPPAIYDLSKYRAKDCMFPRVDEILCEVRDGTVEDIVSIHNPFYSIGWNTVTKEFLSPFKCLRSMPWVNPNKGYKLDTIHGRTPELEDQKYEGTPKLKTWRSFLELCRELNCDAWLSIPHLYTDIEVRKLVAICMEILHPDQTIYLEFSNECWNTANPYQAQTIYCDDVSGYSYYSRQLFDWFSSTGIVNPVKRVGAWMSVSKHDDKEYLASQGHFDVIAVAPYFRFPKDHRDDWHTLSDPIQILSDSLSISFKEMEILKGIVDKHGKEMAAYEGGHEIWNNTEHQLGSDKDSTNLAYDLIYSEEMELVYRKYLKGWKEITDNALFMWLSDSQTPRDGRAFGLRKSMDHFEGPAYTAIKELVKEQPVVKG